MKLVDLDEVTNAIDYTDWYHLFKGKLSKGAEDEEHALYKAEDVYKAINGVPVVDAIPIEYIENLAMIANTEIAESALRELIYRWKAEQETKDEIHDEG